MWVILYLWALGIPMAYTAIVRWLRMGGIAVDVESLVVSAFVALVWPLTASLIVGAYLWAYFNKGR